MNHKQLLEPINHFLKCPTPDKWIEQASKPENLSVILNDHLLCELKAAQSAMFLIRKYAADPQSSKLLLDWFKPYDDFVFKKTR